MTPPDRPAVRAGAVKFTSAWNAQGALARQRRAAMLEGVARLRALEKRASGRSAEARALFEQHGQLLPRERVGLLLDPGMPFLPLCTLAGYLQDRQDPAGSVPGGGTIAGIGFVSGVRCLVVASDSGIDGGAVQPMGLEKMLRLQEIALHNRLPFLHLLERAAPDPARHHVQACVQGRALLHRLARLSAAGIPVITVQHGPASADDAYLAGLSDIVIVAARARALGACGQGEYLAQDDRQALGIAREVVRSLPARPRSGAAEDPSAAWLDGHRHAGEELLSLVPANLRDGVDMREVLVRLVDRAELLEFMPLQGGPTVCAQGSIAGHAVGCIGHGGPIDAAGAAKAAQFIRWMDQLGQPLVYLHHDAGFAAAGPDGQDAMVRHGSSMIRATSGASVPQITIQCGASFGPGQDGICGRGAAPRFLFSWPGAPTAATGSAPGAARPRSDPGAGPLEARADAFHASGLLLDDGVIDPRDTRAVLAFCLDTIAEADARAPRAVPFAVGRTGACGS